MVRRYCVMALMLLCVCLAVQPVTTAYAMEGTDGGDFSYKVVYGPSTPTILGSTKQVQVYAPNNFDAALIVLGYQNDSRLTDDAKALLSNQSTGGTFYDFAQGFSNNNDHWGNQLNFQDLGMNSALSMNNSMYGANNIWSSEYNDTMYDGAKQRVEEVINGNIGGSGGDSGGGSGTSATNWKTAYCSGYSANYNLTSVDRVVYSASVAKPSNIEEMPQYVTINLTGGDLPSFTVDGNCYIFASFDSSTLDVVFTTFDKSMTVQTVTDAKGNDFELKYVNKTGSNVTQTRTFYRFNITGFEDGVLSCNYATKFSNTQKLYNGNLSSVTFSSNQPYFVYGNYGSGGGNPTVPPTNWPENPTPTTPEPPEVPNPPNNPVTPQPPEPTDPTDPVYPTPVYEPDFVWQTADLSAILSAMDAHCRHLQTALHRECSNLWNSLSVKLGNEFRTLRSFLDGQFGWLVDSIDEEFDDFELYLKTLFEWLADQMEFTFTGGGYDDNTVVSWLKKIYYKLGGGTNTRPVDPTVEPDNWWDWLTRLIADWIAGLTDMGLDELAGLLDLLQELITKFPFSIPWDIAALLALLISEPVTPEIRMPQMALTGSGLTQVGEYVVNLQDYNAVWEGVRFIEKVGFCIFLAWNTVHFMDLFKKGANTE